MSKKHNDANASTPAPPPSPERSASGLAAQQAFAARITTPLLPDDPSSGKLLWSAELRGAS